MTAETTPPTSDSIAALLAQYRPYVGVADELMTPDGTVRPVWERMLSYLAQKDPEDLARDFAHGDRYLRDAGVYFQKYARDESGSSNAARTWPLSHIPVLVSEAEWLQISEGLMQRADVLELLMADLFGDNKLVAAGHLPPSLVASNPRWTRSMVGVTPRSGYFLHFLAFDIERGPNGEWWVLGDRTQAPSGAGFVLENRAATRQVFGDLFGAYTVHFLADFYRYFREALTLAAGPNTSDGLGISTEQTVGILTPGPMNDTYFEQAYIARYLGLMLLEGEDLTVINGQVMVRTIEGMRPISVLWRRLDSYWLDPLEQNETSQLGTPGLFNAIRRGSVSLLNAVGSGILQTRAFHAFMPRLSKVLLGEDLKMPSLATWWCGQPAERDYVLANLDRMVIGKALSSNTPFDRADTLAIAGRPVNDQTVDIAAELMANGSDWVGQEAVNLSTTPTFMDGQLVPRPMTLRVFMARTAHGWHVLPGGFARIGQTEDPSAVSMHAGATSADVWIVGNAFTKTTPPIRTTQRRAPEILPSRAADAMLWLGRYIERTEGAIRMLRAWHLRQARPDETTVPLVELLEDSLTDFGLSPDQPIPDGLIASMNAAIGNANKVQDRISVDAWMALDDVCRDLQNMHAQVQAGDSAVHGLGDVLRKLTGFTGLVRDNMYMFMSWRFLSMGRAIERAGFTADLLRIFTDEDAPEGSADLLLEIGDSTTTHRRLFTRDATRDSVLELMSMDVMNPRSILYQLNWLKNNADALPGDRDAAQMTKLSRAVLKIQTELVVHNTESLDGSSLSALRRQFDDLSVTLQNVYLK